MSERWKDISDYLESQMRWEREREPCWGPVFRWHAVPEALEREIYSSIQTPALEAAVQAFQDHEKNKRSKKLMSGFKKAERKRVKLRIAVTGPSGSGKTYSALSLAQGLGKRIAVVDTENGSASLYADRFEFDTLDLVPPYTIAKFVEAIKTAEADEYDVLVIDSISHAWAGDGGLLAKKEALDARGGNSYVNWGGITKEHEQFKARLLNCGIHLICTMRSKQDYVLEINDKGKSTPRKIGLAPIQRDGMEYEFTTVFDLAMDHNPAVSKDRTGLFEGVLTEPLNQKITERLTKWLSEGKEDLKPNLEQLKQLYALATRTGLTSEKVKELIQQNFNGKESSKDLTLEEYEQIYKKLEDYDPKKVTESLNSLGGNSGRVEIRFSKEKGIRISE